MATPERKRGSIPSMLLTVARTKAKGREMASAGATKRRSLP
jgi:hypothetical protein